MGSVSPNDALYAGCVGSPADDLPHARTAFDQLAAEFSPSPAQTERWKQYLQAYPCDLHTDAPSTIN